MQGEPEELTVTFKPVGDGPPAAIRFRRMLKDALRIYGLRAEWPTKEETMNHESIGGVATKIGELTGSTDVRTSTRDDGSVGFDVVSGKYHSGIVYVAPEMLGLDGTAETIAELAKDRIAAAQQVAA